MLSVLLCLERILRIFLEDWEEEGSWVLERQDFAKAISPQMPLAISGPTKRHNVKQFIATRCAASAPNQPHTTVAWIPTQIQHDRRLLGWVPRVQCKVQQGPSTQMIVAGTDLVQHDAGVNTEKAEIVILGDGKGAKIVEKGDTGIKLGEEGESKGVSCKGKEKMQARK
ncbi:uncharacterized protein G2W53_011745 [Senna tora]|uniref:Uncharacterized protein n=1 Tax=Senna tora TaxID=362788 RepID=A0A834X2C7_9FABA|nr:uncharacterized protein G2W53_011745 [Senna tora]